jgi:antitoxin (DNA-binding transcriptional repressor) of toxin-antitoxin stability system
MKAVGVKALKNNLSRYLKLAKEGETILITDRDEVIAEMHEPSVKSTTQMSQWEAYLNRLAREGSLRKATRKAVSVQELLAGKPKWPEDVDWQAIYDEVRSDRF